MSEKIVVRMDVVDGEWDVNLDADDLTLNIVRTLEQFPTRCAALDFIGHMDGHHFVIESGQIMDGDDYWYDITYDELEEMLDCSWNSREFVTNGIEEE